MKKSITIMVNETFIKPSKIAAKNENRSWSGWINNLIFQELTVVKNKSQKNTKK